MNGVIFFLLNKKFRIFFVYKFNIRKDNRTLDHFEILIRLADFLLI
jgi:hypothetical protein